MGRNRDKSMVLWVVLLMLSTNNLILPVISVTSNNFANEKNYYSPSDPHLPTLPSGHHGSSHKHKSHGSPSSGGQSNCRTPPSPSGSGGSGGYYPSPTPPSKGGSGGSYHPPKHTPTSPPKGGGCACPSPPPTSGGSGSYYPPTPRTPLVSSPPVIPAPIVPSPPYLPGPSTPTPFDPTSPPFPCTYWGSHPGLVFGVLGWWATVGGIFGVTTLPGLNSATSLEEMLTNPRNDGYGSLYREGTASFLNSVASKNFAFSTKEVKDTFLDSLASEKAAAAQAKLFKQANEKRIKRKPALAASRP